MIPIEDLTDVTLAIEDTDEDDEEDLTDVTPGEWWYLLKNFPKIWEFSENLRIFRKSENDDNGESYQVMEVIKWWKLSGDKSYLVMKVIYWWKLSSDESYLVMKLI